MKPARTRQLSRALTLLAMEDAQEYVRSRDPIGYWAPSERTIAKRERFLRRRIRALGYRNTRAVWVHARKAGFRQRDFLNLMGSILRRIDPWD